MRTTGSGAPGSTGRKQTGWKQTAGIAALVSSAVMFFGTTLVSPNASAGTATASPAVVRSLSADGLGKRFSFEDADMLIQKEAPLPDQFSDADPELLTTPPIDELFIQNGYPKRYDVKQAGIPQVREGDSVTFRNRIYPRLLVLKDGFLQALPSNITAVETTDATDNPGTGCNLTEPVLVEAEGSLEYSCTLTNVRSKGVGTEEDLVSTFTVTRTGLDGGNVLTLSESAAYNVVVPCISLVKEVRQAGTTGDWLDAQTPDTAALIATGAAAEYRITTKNCGEMDLTNVVVTDTISGCNRTIDALAIGGEFRYSTADAGQTNCTTSPVSTAVCSTAGVSGQPMLYGKANGAFVTASDPACVTPPKATTTTSTTTTTTTTTTIPAPTTVAPAPCLSIVKEVRQAGTDGLWLDAQLPASAAIIASGATAEYRITVTNCGNTDLVGVSVTDTIAGCNRVLGPLATGATSTYTTATAGQADCSSTPVTAPSCSTATVSGQPVVDGKPAGDPLVAADPACIAPTTVVPTTAVPTTVAPTTVATTVGPTTVAPTTVAPTTVAPTTVATTVAPTTVAATTSTTLVIITPPQPCLTIKTFVRQAGSNGPWQDADTPGVAASIAQNATAEYQIEVTNCGSVPLLDLSVTSAVTGCNRVIGRLDGAQKFTFSTADAQNTGCRTSPALVDGCLTAIATANTGQGTPTLSASDPACIKIVPPVVAPAPVVPASVAPASVAATPVATQPAPTTAPVLKVLDAEIAKSTETEDLSQTGSTTTPMLMMAATLLLVGIVLLGSSRTQPSKRHSFTN